jgi:hypothetical protein
MKAKEMRDFGIEGSITGGDASGREFQDWFQKGGLFRSNKSGTNYSALDADLGTALGMGAKGILQQTQAWATALKLPAESLAGVTTSFKVKLTSDEKANQEAIAGVLKNYSQALENRFTAVLAPFQRSEETISDTLQRLASSLGTINPALELLGLTMYSTSAAGANMASQLADAFGGLENFTQATAGYYAEFYSEAERTAKTTAQLTETLGGLGVALPTTRDAYRQLVEAQDLNTEAGRKNFAVLVQLSGTFAGITPVVEDLAAAGNQATEALRSAADILRERQGLERQLLQLQGDTAALRALDRAALDQSNRALFDHVQALQDNQAAAQAATESERTLAAERERISQERQGLERQLLQLQGDTVALRALDRAALNEGNRALFDRVTALRESQAAESAAAEAFINRTKTFKQNFYEESELAGIQARQVQAELFKLGVNTEFFSRADFRRLVEGTDVSNEQGRQRLSQLLTLGEAFAPVGRFLEANGGSLNTLANMAPATGAVQQILGGNSIEGLSSLTNATTAGASATVSTLQRLIERVGQLESALVKALDKSGRAVADQVYYDPNVSWSGGA